MLTPTGAGHSYIDADQDDVAFDGSPGCNEGLYTKI